MDDAATILDAEAMKKEYGPLYAISPRLRLRKELVSPELWPLLPYAEFWGVTDDCAREEMLSAAPPRVMQNLRIVFQQFDDQISDWLEKLSAEGKSMTDEFVAFVALMMVADSISD